MIFPSLYEGFGLPILEAMQLGVPVITSNKGSIPEIGGKAVHYVDPYSTNDIVKAIEIFSNPTGNLNKFKVAGLEQAKKFSPSEYKKKFQLDIVCFINENTSYI